MSSPWSGDRVSGLRDELTGELVVDPDGVPITELEAHDALDLRASLSIEERAAGERAWRYGHVIVDEAQDLTPMQWRMVARRARGHSMTIVGDLAQRSVGDPVANWTEVLPPELGDAPSFELSTNYRSPREVAEMSGRLLARIAPGLSSPAAMRTSGHPPQIRRSESIEHDLPRIVDDELAALEAGRVAVIRVGAFTHPSERVVAVSPSAAKGMEFDSVIVVEPAEITELPNGLSLLYIALTRTTDRLTLLHSRPLPDYLLE